MTSAAPSGASIKANGGRIYFEVRGHGEPVLLLHGFSGAGSDWMPSLLRFGQGFQLIMPDMRGHGKSGTLTSQFRHVDAAADMFALLDHLKIKTFKGVGISAGGNVLLHMAMKQPERMRAMVIVSATPYFPEEARAIMRNFAKNVPEQQWEAWRKKHAGGDPQIKALLDSTAGFADSHDDLNFTSEHLKKIQARTLIVQGDRDPMYPVQLSVDMAKAIPRSALWVIPNAGHGPVIGEKWPEFIKTAAAFLRAD